MFSKDLIQNSSFSAGFEAGFAKGFFFFLVKFDLVESWTGVLDLFRPSVTGVLEGFDRKL